MLLLDYCCVQIFWGAQRGFGWRSALALPQEAIPNDGFSRWGITSGWFTSAAKAGLM
jgi:hypothetical protein